VIMLKEHLYVTKML